MDTLLLPLPYVVLDGNIIDDWKVSTGRIYDSTPTGFFMVRWMAPKWNSKKYDNARMDDAMFITATGIALHATYGNNIKQLGTPQSHGCIRQHPANADKLFKLVEKYGRENTLIIIQK